MKRLPIFVIIIFLGGCYPTTLEQKANISAINQQILKDGKITFITYNQSEFKLLVEEMDTLQIKGYGKIKEKNSSLWKNFQGTIPIDSIDLLYFSKTDYGKSLLINAAILTLIIKGIQAGEGPSTPTVSIEIPTSNSSCPFIYSWQGSDYELEGEAFGIALGKAREMTTCTVLNKLIPTKNKLKVRITNERPETHFINNISLHFAEVDSNAIVVADNNQELWPVYKVESPISAVDKTGKNISDQIHKSDGLFWESGLSKSEVFSDYTNSIELTFNREEKSKQASLVLEAINTQFSYFVFERLFEFLGNQSLSFMHDIENDRELIQLIEKWTIESSLKVSIWDGVAWQPCGILYPEANVTPFSRLIRLDIPATAENLIKLRLTSLADVWKIDAVNIDWTQVNKIKTADVPIKSFTGPYSEDNVELILAEDDFYATLLPSQKIELIFDKPNVLEGKKACYSLSVGGYLYEWFPAAKSNNLFSDLGNIIGNNKIDYVKILLNHKNLLLPPLYNDWLNKN